MHQSKKGNDWHFRLKAHIGMDAASGLVHTVIGTAGNVSDVTQAGFAEGELHSGLVLPSRPGRVFDRAVLHSGG